MKHPIQKPVMVSKVLRYTENKVISLMLDLLNSQDIDLNRLYIAGDSLPKEDWYQFNQLVGYSLSGAPIPDHITDIAYKMYEEKKDENLARAEIAEEKLDKVKEALRFIVPEIFCICPEDLK